MLEVVKSDADFILMTLNNIIGSFGNSITYNLLNRGQRYSNPVEWQNKSITYFFYLQRDFFY